MKFRQVKRFIGETLEDALSWLTKELNSVLRELYIGLGSLDFEENFNSYSWTGTLSAGEERQIPHPFKSLPMGHLIFKQIGNGVVDSGTTVWTTDFAYLRNNGAVSVEVWAKFFK